ncbi:MAG: Rid family detoxifying hydrolase [Terriglobales bacterium]
MLKQAIVAAKAPPAVGPFAAAVRANGFIYISGQIGLDPKTGKLLVSGIEKQTEQVFANLRAILDAADKGFADVVRAGVYLTDLANFQVMNAIYAKYITAPFAARTTIGVAALPLGAIVEIDLVVMD